MKVRSRVLLGLAVSVIAAGAAAAASQVPAKSTADRDPVFAQMGRLVGGHWVTQNKLPDGTPIADLKFEWDPDHKSIHGTGKIAGEWTESRNGWDPASKSVYYLDSHGPETVYFGHAHVEGSELVMEFHGLVGDTGTYRSRAHFADNDTYENSIVSMKDGQVVREAVHVRLHRQK